MTAASDSPDADSIKQVVEVFVADWQDGKNPDLDEVCSRHSHLGPALKQRLEDFAFIATGLLGAEAENEETLQSGDAAPANGSIGPYRILRVLGEGGMGLVYLAEQREPIHRRVAVKVIRSNTDSAQVLKRFRAERQALARMEHDNIAKILDAGTIRFGNREQPYFVMEHVRGEPLTDYCGRHQLTIRDRLDLFVQICDGVQHAHQKGVIHRDLKPSNILVSEQGDRRVPKIIDFGLARATDHRLSQETLITNPGALIGTPEYMSPEQAGFDTLDIDSRTDIYSLGVILYEMLTGALPFSTKELRSAGWSEVQRIIRDVQPSKPSKRCPSLRGDLDWITMRALEKDRNRRYDTAAQLAADVERHLHDEPVEAGPPGLRYRAGKLLRRHRTAFGAATAVLLALVGGLVAAVWQAQVAAAALTQYRQMRDVPLCQDLLAEAEREIWPAHPANSAKLTSWLQRATGLAARAPTHRDLLTQLRTAESNYETRFRVSVLRELIAGLDRLENQTIPLATKLRERARTLRARSIEAKQAEWSAAITALTAADGTTASAGYRGMPPLTPQLGLVPLGMDPRAKLWEFALLDSGSVPQRDAAGVLQIDPTSAIVLVLIPPGRFAMGALPSDRFAQDDEAPVTEIALDAFFLSKYEMTQGQWQRLMGENPSMYPAPAMGPDRKRLTLRHPVENVSFDMCDLAMHRLGLTLPTEAQWEYAARAGSETTWWTGDQKQSLDGAANVLDAYCRDHGGPSGLQYDAELDDGFVFHAPVGSLRANEFGLHDVVGNVWEWCIDIASDYDSPPQAGNGLRTGTRPEVRCCRGGSFNLSAKDGRSANRGRDQTHSADGDFGVRPARAIY